MKYDRFGSFGHIIPRFFLVCKRCGEKLANQFVSYCTDGVIARRITGIHIIWIYGLHIIKAPSSANSLNTKKQVYLPFAVRWNMYSELLNVS